MVVIEIMNFAIISANQCDIGNFVVMPESHDITIDPVSFEYDVQVLHRFSDEFIQDIKGGFEFLSNLQGERLP